MSCSGAQYCGNFSGPNVSQAIVKQNGKWYLVYNSANFGDFALSVNSGSGSSGNTASGNTGSGSTSAGTAGAGSLTAFCSDLNGVVNTIANATGNLSAPSNSHLQSFRTKVSNLINESSKGTFQEL